MTWCRVCGWDYNVYYDEEGVGMSLEEMVKMLRSLIKRHGKKAVQAWVDDALDGAMKRDFREEFEEAWAVVNK